MELIKQQIAFRKKTVESSLHTDETTDSIIPDTLADIERILDVSPLVMIRDKQPHQDSLSVKINAIVTVLYIPESGEGVASVQIPMNFILTDNVSEITPSSDLMCSISESIAHAQIINPRKISVTLSVDLKIIAFDNAHDEIILGVTGEESEFSECKKNSIDCINTVASITRNFTVSEEIKFPLSTDKLLQILRYNIDLQVSETKVMLNRILIKGFVNISSLAENKDHSLETTNFAIPFSQIMDINNISDAMTSQVNLSLRSFDAVPTTNTGNENTNLIVTIGICADIIISDVDKYEILEDIYSTKNQLDVKYKTYNYISVNENKSKCISYSEIIELGVSPSDITEAVCSIPSSILVNQYDDVTMLPIICRLIFLDENGSYQSASRKFFIKANELEKGSYNVFVSTPVTRIGTESINISGDITLLSTGSSMQNVVQVNEINEKDAFEKSKNMSILIRRIEIEDSLWNLAKKHHVSVNEIKTANKMDCDTLTKGTMILIPIS